MKKEKLFGKTLTELTSICKNFGLPDFTPKQIVQWLYNKDIDSIVEMTNVSQKGRSLLASHYEIGRRLPTEVQESSDGTKKYLFATAEEHFVETAMIPERERKTVCLSSQVGCKMACRFCMTGKQGFQGHLSAGDILNQYRSIAEWQQLTNVVYMGMGEPLDNLDEVLKSLEILTADWGFALSPRRLTVSTIGIVPTLRRFIEESECHLAVSLHTPFAEERRDLMPVERAYPIKNVLSAIRDYDFGLQRRVSFEYIIFEGLNDTRAHVNALVKLLSGLRCRVNLIRFHPIPHSSLQGAGEQKMEAFKAALNKKGLTATIRASRGEDILAACGLLSTNSLAK